MSDDVSQEDLTITTLMQDSDSSHQANPSSKFKFCSNNFDWLRFLYDHVSTSEDVKKVNFIGAQQLTQNLRAYLMRCTIMSMGLFEVGDAQEHNEIRLNKQMTQSRDDLKTQTGQVEDLTKQLFKMKK